MSSIENSNNSNSNDKAYTRYSSRMNTQKIPESPVSRNREQVTDSLKSSTITSGLIPMKTFKKKKTEKEALSQNEMKKLMVHYTPKIKRIDAPKLGTSFSLASEIDYKEIQREVKRQNTNLSTMSEKEKQELKKNKDLVHSVSQIYGTDDISKDIDSEVKDVREGKEPKERTGTKKASLFNPISKSPIKNMKTIDSPSIKPSKLGSVNISPQREKKHTSKEPSNFNLDDILAGSKVKTTSNIPSMIYKEPQSSNIRVYARFRPLNSVEIERGKENIIVSFENENSCTINGGPYSNNTYTLDRIYNMETAQQTMFTEVAKSTINDVLAGFNGTIFAYGQSGSGKTYTMYGTDLYDNSKGMIPRCIDYIWEFIEANSDISFEIKFSMLEIYKENLFDLLNISDKPAELKIYDHPKKGPYVSNLIKQYIDSKEELFELLLQADELRATAETALNKTSSRSHLLFTLEILQKLPDDSEKIGVLNMVDLAGSEKLSKSKAEGDRYKEGVKINLSLLTLGTVINSLVTNAKHVPYAESKLTRILQNSLGGNFKTSLVVTCSPHIFNAEETISTFLFAQRAKKIKNKVKANIIRSPEEMEKIIAELYSEVHKVKKDLKKYKNFYETIKSSKDEIIDNKFNLSNFSMNDSKGSEDFEISNRDKRNRINTVINSGIDSPNAKRNEISKLKEELKEKEEEIKSLKDQIDSISKEVNFTKSINELKVLSESVFTSLSGNTSSLNMNLIEEIRLLKEENSLLRKKLNVIDQRYFTNIKELKYLDSKIFDNNELDSIKNDALFEDESFFDLNFQEKVKHFNSSLEENFPFRIEHDSAIVESYKQFVTNNKLIFAKAFQETLNKKDIFQTKLDESNEKNTKYKKFKNSYVKLLLISTYYEKVLFDLVDKVSLDFKRLVIERSFARESCEVFGKFQGLFSQVLTLIERIKEMKTGSNLNQSVLITDQEFVENGGPNVSFMKSSYRPRNIRKRVTRNKDTKESLEKDGILPRRLTSTLSAKKVDIDLNDYNIYTSLPYREFKKESNNEYDQGKSNNDTVFCFEDELMLTESNKNEESRIFKTQQKRSPSPIVIKTTRTTEPAVGNIQVAQQQSHIIHTGLNQTLKYVDEIAEIKALSSELELYKDYSLKLTEELNTTRQNMKEIEEIVSKFQNNSRELYEIQSKNFSNSIHILHDLYQDELVSRRNVVRQLTEEIDDILLNKNTLDDSNRIHSEPSHKLNNLTRNAHSCSNLMKDYFNAKKTSILDDSGESKIARVSDILLSFVNESGVATKKMDFIRFNLNPSNESVDVKFGSGLDKNFPSKSPLERTFKFSLLGDISESPEHSFMLNEESNMK